MRLLGSGCLTQVSIYPDNPDDWGYEAKTSIRIVSIAANIGD